MGKEEHREGGGSFKFISLCEHSSLSALKSSLKSSKLTTLLSTDWVTEDENAGHVTGAVGLLLPRRDDRYEEEGRELELELELEFL